MKAEEVCADAVWLFCRQVKLSRNLDKVGHASGPTTWGKEIISLILVSVNQRVCNPCKAQYSFVLGRIVRIDALLLNSSRHSQRGFTIGVQGVTCRK